MGFTEYFKSSRARFGNSKRIMPQSQLKFGLPSLLLRKDYAISTVGSKSMGRLSRRPILKIDFGF
jgi:hypothetical protein